MGRKRRVYNKRAAEVEHESFISNVLFSPVGWGPSAMIMYKSLVSLIKTKHSPSYSATMSNDNDQM